MDEEHDLGMTDDEVILRVDAVYAMFDCSGCALRALMMLDSKTQITIDDAVLRRLVDTVNGHNHQELLHMMVCGDGVRLIRGMSAADMLVASRTRFRDHGSFSPTEVASRYALAIARRGKR